MTNADAFGTMRALGMEPDPWQLDNDRDPGIAAVKSRIETGTLKILEGACPNLLAEAQLYRYDPDSRSEQTKKGNDHALDALRYLVGKIDWRKLALIRKGQPQGQLAGYAWPFERHQSSLGARQAPKNLENGDARLTPLS
jgi:hypothetical protein